MIGDEGTQPNPNAQHKPARSIKHALSRCPLPPPGKTDFNAGCHLPYNINTCIVFILKSPVCFSAATRTGGGGSEHEMSPKR